MEIHIHLKHLPKQQQQEHPSTSNSLGVINSSITVSKLLPESVESSLSLGVVGGATDIIYIYYIHIQIITKNVMREYIKSLICSEI
jgi:hypothetical protein